MNPWIGVGGDMAVSTPSALTNPLHRSVRRIRRKAAKMHCARRGVVLCFFALLLSFEPTLAQDRGALEATLAEAEISEHPAILADLVDALRDSDPEQAVVYGEQALVLLAQHPDPATRVRVLNEMSWALRLLGRYARAIDLANESIKIASANNDLAGLGRANNNLGSVYWYLGDYDSVLEYWLAALEIRVQTGDQLGVAGSLNNMGLLYFNLEENQRAIDQFEQALEISRANGNLEYQANHLDNLGEVYARMGEAELAESHYREALLIARGLGNLKVEVSVLVNLGSFMLQAGDLPAAQEYLDHGLQLAQQIGASSKQREAALGLARLAFQRQRFDQALELIRSINPKVSSLPEKVLLRDSYRLLSDIHAARGDYQAALIALADFSELNEEMLKTQRDNKLTSLQIQFETEARERQIQLLTQATEIQELDLAKASGERRAMLVGIGLLGMFLLFVLFAYRTKIRANHLIYSQYQELDATRRELQRLAVTDPLTGLLNRRALGEKVAAEASRAADSGSSFAIGIIDLDLFKQINDEHGHETGDRVLIEVANRISSKLRSMDSVARWGGEEFLILMPDTDLEVGLAVAKRVHDAITAAPFRDGDLKISISATVGVSLYDTDVVSTQAVIRAADQAMYEGKRAGGGKVTGKAA